MSIDENAAWLEFREAAIKRFLENFSGTDLFPGEMEGRKELDTDGNENLDAADVFQSILFGESLSVPIAARFTGCPEQEEVFPGIDVASSNLGSVETFTKAETFGSLFVDEASNAVVETPTEARCQASVGNVRMSTQIKTAAEASTDQQFSDVDRPEENYVVINQYQNW